MTCLEQKMALRQRFTHAQQEYSSLCTEYMTMISQAVSAKNGYCSMPNKQECCQDFTTYVEETNTEVYQKQQEYNVYETVANNAINDIDCSSSEWELDVADANMKVNNLEEFVTSYKELVQLRKNQYTTKRQACGTYTGEPTPPDIPPDTRPRW